MDNNQLVCVMILNGTPSPSCMEGLWIPVTVLKYFSIRALAQSLSHFSFLILFCLSFCIPFFLLFSLCFLFLLHSYSSREAGCLFWVVIGTAGLVILGWKHQLPCLMILAERGRAKVAEHRGGTLTHTALVPRALPATWTHTCNTCKSQQKNLNESTWINHLGEWQSVNGSKSQCVFESLGESHQVRM